MAHAHIFDGFIILSKGKEKGKREGIKSGDQMMERNIKKGECRILALGSSLRTYAENYVKHHRKPLIEKLRYIHETCSEVLSSKKNIHLR